MSLAHGFRYLVIKKHTHLFIPFVFNPAAASRFPRSSLSLTSCWVRTPGSIRSAVTLWVWLELGEPHGDHALLAAVTCTPAQPGGPRTLLHHHPPSSASLPSHQLSALPSQPLQAPKTRVKSELQKQCDTSMTPGLPHTGDAIPRNSRGHWSLWHNVVRRSLCYTPGAGWTLGRVVRPPGTWDQQAVEGEDACWGRRERQARPQNPTEAGPQL